ncbi:MAG: transcription termination/antitermination protein NusA [Candidatus Melainabacteria bacterium]|nr:transcription termination/antitermination protein NusA [Candidatus Melainabacteria bacterium]
MGDKLLEAAEELERERNIPQEEFISYVCDAIVAAYKKKVPDHDVEGVRAIFDTETGEIGIFAPKEVVDEVSNEYHEISLADAQDLIPDVTSGEVLEIEVTPADFSEFGRIAAQTAKQLITQRLREAEKELIKKEFEARKGTCTTGQIERIEVISNSRNNVIVNLGRVEGCMPSREQLPGETYRVGNRVRVYVLELRDTGRVPQIIVSQAHPELVRELFELYVPEIEDNTVEIKSIAREAGYRTKIAVHSEDSDVDPVGACIGTRGVRIQNVVAELRNEKIDVIRYSLDPVDYISNALSPARITTVALYDDSPEANGKRAEVIVPDDQLSLAIGRGGQNVRLAAKLTGWKIDIKSESQAGGSFRNMDELTAQ